MVGQRVRLTPGDVPKSFYERLTPGMTGTVTSDGDRSIGGSIEVAWDDGRTTEVAPLLLRPIDAPPGDMRSRR